MVTFKFAASSLLGVIIEIIAFQLPVNLNRGEKMSQKTMFEAKCTDCGKIALVPFKPTEGKPVYCKECFSKHSKKPTTTNRQQPRKTDAAPIVIGKEGWARRRDTGFVHKESESTGAFHKFTPAP